MDILTIMAAFLIIVGGFATLLYKSAFNKLVMLGVLTAGALMYLVRDGYLDVAIAVALLMPVGSLFVLFLLGKKKQKGAVEEKTNSEEVNDA